MNILLTGGKGFLGSSLKKWFNDHTQYNIYIPSHSDLNLLQLEQVKQYIKQNHITGIINAAWQQDIDKNRYYPDSEHDLCKNLIMFQNLTLATPKHCKLFLFGTGSEYDNDADILSHKESDIYSTIPIQFGGFVKNLIATKVNHISNISCYYLRIFGAFGAYERNDRFIKGNLLNIIHNKDILIHQNRWFDFIYVNDIALLIYSILTDIKAPNDINCVYQQKYTLLDIANVLLDITKSKVNIKIDKNDMGLDYISNDSCLSKLKLSLVGIEHGIRQTYTQMLS